MHKQWGQDHSWGLEQICRIILDRTLAIENGPKEQMLYACAVCMFA